MSNPYEILGIDKDASLEDATKAYKRMVKRYHPDTPNGNEEKFKEIGEAYDKIKNPPEQKFDFDAASFADIGETFADIFGQRGGKQFNGFYAKEPARRIRYNISLEQAFSGFTIGNSQVPAGVRKGMILQEGSATQYGADTEYQFSYKAHPTFEVDGANLSMTVDVPHLECVVGGSVSIDTICGKSLKLNIPKLSSVKTKLKVGGHGMNTLYNGARGDLFVNLNPIFPKKISSEEEELYRRLYALSVE